MFRSKKDVDRHVQEILRKVKTELERNLRCYNIAKQYYKVGDYESAKRYVSMYLLAKEDSPLAHKLLGQIWEKLGHNDRALTSYKSSLESDANQPDLVLKICEFMCTSDLPVDVERARYWCDRGAELFPHDPAIFRLKEKLLTLGGNSNSQAFESLINSELKARPLDVGVHIRLLYLYLETGRTKAAYNHAVELESRQTFHRNLSFYECLAKVCDAYQKEFVSHVDWLFYTKWVYILDRVAELSLSEISSTGSPKNLADCVSSVFNMDQVLYKANQITLNKESSSVIHFYKEFIMHMSAQLCFHVATLMFKQAKKDQLWKEATRGGTPLLFLALTPPPEIESAWCMGLKDNLKKSLEIWINDAYYRVSQAGYVLLCLAKDGGNQFTEKIAHTCSGNWRERIFQKIYNTRDHRAAAATSHIVNYREFVKVSVKLPIHGCSPLRIEELVPVYEKIYPDSLHHLVWLGIETSKYDNSCNFRLSPEFHIYGFSSLKFSVHNLGNVSVETLNKLDIDAFLYATVFCASAGLDEEILGGFYSSDRPSTLPADIANHLCTQDQAKWWSAAYAVNNQRFDSTTSLAELRQTLQHGIEVIRVVGNHGLDVHLIVKLARMFAERAANEEEGSVNHAFLEDRTSLYWTTALPLLEKIEHNIAIRSPNNRLFEYPRKELSAAEVSDMLEEGRFFVASRLMKEERYEEAIEAFKPLRSSHAAFNQALIYKKLAEAEIDQQQKEEITSEMRSKHIILLTKAREYLYLTKDRIRTDRRRLFHENLAVLIEEVESALSRIEPDSIHRGEGEGGVSEGSLSSADSPTVEPLVMPLNSINSDRLGSRTSRVVHHTSTPNRVNARGDYHHSINGAMDLTEISELVRSQTDQNFKKIIEKFEVIFEEQKSFINQSLLPKFEAIIEEQKSFVNQSLCPITNQLTHLTTQVDDLRREVLKIKPPAPEDLYMFDESEDYTEDVINQYPTSFPSPYQGAGANNPYYPTRGVQGTSTVTYGAPPAAVAPPSQPIIPPHYFTPRVDTALYQPPAAQTLGFFNQGALPFSEGQQLIDFLRPSVTSVQKMQPPPSVPAPINVVITTSDTLPTGPPPGPQPTLSVTIPPQHRLGTVPPPVVQTQLPHPPPPQPVAQPVLPVAQVSQPVTVTVTTPSVIVSSPASVPQPAHAFQIPMPPIIINTSLEKAAMLSADEDTDEDHEDGQCVSSYPDFQPAIPLPDKIILTTGEEGETVLFESHAKLFRFVNKEWKERGVGVVKILRNSSTDKVRLLMRRDKVHNICANHLLRSDMELTPLKNSNNALIWVANDYADEKVQLEKLCIKFKKPEETARFKNAFNDAKKLCPASTPQTSPEKPVKDDQKSDVSPEKCKEVDDKVPVICAGKLFVDDKKSEKIGISIGKVNFGGFTFSSMPNVKKVDEIKKDKADDKKKETSSQSPFAGFSFALQKSGGDHTPNKDAPKFSNILKKPTFVPSVLETSSEEVVGKSDKDQLSVVSKEPVVGISTVSIPKSLLNEGVSQHECAANVVNLMITSGKETEKSEVNPSSQKASWKPKESKTPTLTECLTSDQSIDTSNVIDFAVLSKCADKDGFKSDPKFKNFEGAGTPVFKKFESIGTPVGNKLDKTSERETVEEFVPTAEFKPVVPLPELIEVKTGEEGQEVLFEEHSKLLRFDTANKEWKERGIGTMKVLRNPNTGIGRLIMRREQVLKVCCNQNITENLEIKPALGSEKAWTWFAQDYSDGEMKYDCFALRFKTVKLAQKFKSVVDQLQQDMKGRKENATASPTLNVTSECLNQTTLPAKQLAGVSQSSPSNNLWNKTLKSGTEEALPKLSDISRPKSGSWECKACYAINESKQSTCACCDTPKVHPKTMKSGTEEALPKLSDISRPKSGSWECKACYAINESKQSTCACCDTPKVHPKTLKSGTEEALPKLADIFRPKSGSWECKACYTINESKQTTCACCDTSKVQPKQPITLTSSQLLSEIPSLKPKIGSWNCTSCYVQNDQSLSVCQACQATRANRETQNVETKQSLAQLFKPKAGSWECSSCLVINDATNTVCPACGTAKSGYENNKSQEPQQQLLFSFGVNKHEKLQEPQQQQPFSFSTKQTFNFGVPSAEKSVFSFGIPQVNTQQQTGFSFGAGQSSEHKAPAFTIGGKASEIKEQPTFTFMSQPTTESKETGFTVIQPILTSKPVENISFVAQKPAAAVSTAAVVTTGTATITTATASATTVNTTATSSRVDEKPLFNFRSVPTESKESSFVFDSTKPSSGFSFSSKPIIDNKVADNSQNSNKPSAFASAESLFGNGKKHENEKQPASFVFGSTTSIESDASDQFQFGSSRKFDFHFSVTPKATHSVGSQNISKSPRSPGEESVSDGDEHEESSDHIHFQPIIPLPDKVPLTTGEENETILYSHRAKLFRFAESVKAEGEEIAKKEWKERGVGDIKILKHNETNKIRLLMRREPILKLCLNHYLTPDITMTPKDDKSWMWYAQDFTDGEIKHENFCIRFKTPDIAKEFKIAIDAATAEILQNSVLKECSTKEIVTDETRIEEAETKSDEKNNESPAMKSFAFKLPETSTPSAGGFSFSSRLGDSAGIQGYVKPLFGGSSLVNLSSNRSIFGESSSVPVGPNTDGISKEQGNLPLDFSSLGISDNQKDVSTSKVLEAESDQPISETPAAPTQPFAFETQKSVLQQEKDDTMITPKTSFGDFKQSTLQKADTIQDTGGKKSNFDDDLEIVYEHKVSKELQEQARKLQLPLNFYDYMDKEPCPGCPGCETEEENATSGDSTKKTADTKRTITDQKKMGSKTSEEQETKPTNRIAEATPFKFLIAAPSTNSRTFGDQSKQQTVTPIISTHAAESSTPAFISSQSSFLSFSSVAAASANTNAFKVDPNKTFPGTGSKVFGSIKLYKSSKDNDESDEGSDGGAKEPIQEPHFEPVVPLPAVIQLSTGEEEEVREFCSRAKLYRFTSEQWKERGVGEVKILHHPVKNTFRLLMRREQVFKVVLNQLITPEITLSPLPGNENAWCWVGMNLADEYTEAKVETLAIRFGKIQLAQEFKDKVEECIAKIKEIKAAAATVKSFKGSDASQSKTSAVEGVEKKPVGVDYLTSQTLYPETTEEDDSDGDDDEEEEGADYDRDYYDDEDDDDDDDEDEDDDDDINVQFQKRATLFVRSPGKMDWRKLGMGDLQIMCNIDMISRIRMKGEDNGYVCNILISADSNVQGEGKDCKWTGYDESEGEPELKEFWVKFSSEAAVKEFLSVFNEVKDFAKQAEIYTECDTTQ